MSFPQTLNWADVHKHSSEFGQARTKVSAELSNKSDSNKTREKPNTTRWSPLWVSHWRPLPSLLESSRVCLLFISLYWLPFLTVEIARGKIRFSRLLWLSRLLSEKAQEKPPLRHPPSPPKCHFPLFSWVASDPASYSLTLACLGWVFCRQTLMWGNIEPGARSKREQWSLLDLYLLSHSCWPFSRMGSKKSFL